MKPKYELLAQVGGNWRACIETDPITTNNGLFSPRICLERLAGHDCLGAQRWEVAHNFRVAYVAHKIEIVDPITEKWTAEELTVLLRAIEALRKAMSKGDYTF